MSTEGKNVDEKSIEELIKKAEEIKNPRAVLWLELLQLILKTIFPDGAVTVTKDFVIKVHVDEISTDELINLGYQAKALKDSLKFTLKRSGTGITILLESIKK